MDPARVGFGSVADPVELGERGHEAVVWQLEPLVDSQGADGARRLLSEARSRAGRFATELGGGIADLGPDALVDAVGEYTEIRELLWRASGYAHMRGYADSSDPVAGALAGAAEAARAEVDARLLFFEPRSPPAPLPACPRGSPRDCWTCSSLSPRTCGRRFRK
jgi:hypothetical protein